MCNIIYSRQTPYVIKATSRRKSKREISETIVCRAAVASSRLFVASGSWNRRSAVQHHRPIFLRTPNLSVQLHGERHHQRVADVHWLQRAHHLRRVVASKRDDGWRLRRTDRQSGEG